MFRFYIALYVAKIVEIFLKLIGRKASFFPGKIAIKICPDFLGKIAKPETIIGVTGTNGKTTVSNLINDSLTKCGYKVLNNKYGGNINSGLASSLVYGTSLNNKTKYKIAVFEIDERSSPKIYPYIQPKYIVCTNLFRDSILRNAHTEFIFDIINNNLPKESTLILNADDLISSFLGKENKKIFFGIDKQETDLTESVNLINDMRICPKCHSKLKYEYVRYHHIGKAYCPNCDFKSFDADYEIQSIDYDKQFITVNHNNEKEKYKLISDSIFNMYNEIAVITLLKELKISTEKIQETLQQTEIVESRYQENNVNGIKIVSNLAKGMNAVACSCVFDYLKKAKGKKEVVLILDDFFEARESSENISWIYDTDFEILKSKDIEKVVLTGKRSKDYYLRLLLAGIPREKISCTINEQDAVNYLSLKKDNTIYILYDVYNLEILSRVKKKIIEAIKPKQKNMFKFYIALFIAKFTRLILRILKKNATTLPGNIAIKICPDFLGKIDKPERIIGVTGTNGKTTVANLIIDGLEKNKYTVLSNRLGGNINTGIASSLIAGTTLSNHTKYQIAVFEIDERSSVKVYPYINPDFIVCTNLFRDSIGRNAHPEFIFNVINNSLPEKSTLILNADDSISSLLGHDTNKKVYFGIDKQDTDLKEPINLIQDGTVCPKCNHKLTYNYLKYMHIGNAYCENCGYKSYKADYMVREINYKDSYITVNQEQEDVKYKLIADSIFNIYNEISVIALFKEFGFTNYQIENTLENINIIQSRYNREKCGDITIVNNMAKDLNAVACSTVFDFLRKDEGKKEIVLILDNYYDARGSSEINSWIYDADFEFLKNDDIDKIIATGKRSKDTYLRLLMAGIDKSKLDKVINEQDAIKYLSLDKGETVYLLYGVDNVSIMNKLKKKIVDKIKTV